MQGRVYFICHDLHFQIDFQPRTRKLCCFHLFAFSLVCFFPGWLPSQIETWNFPNLVVCGMVWGKVFMPLPLQPIGLREKLWSCFCLCPLFQRIFSKASNPIRGPHICPIKSQWWKIIPFYIFRIFDPNDGGVENRRI